MPCAKLSIHFPSNENFHFRLFRTFYVRIALLNTECEHYSLHTNSKAFTHKVKTWGTPAHVREFIRTFCISFMYTGTPAGYLDFAHRNRKPILVFFFFHSSYVLWNIQWFIDIFSTHTCFVPTYKYVFLIGYGEGLIILHMFQTCNYSFNKNAWWKQVAKAF